MQFAKFSFAKCARFSAEKRALNNFNPNDEAGNICLPPEHKRQIAHLF